MTANSTALIRKTLEGGCQCGRVRYRSAVHIDNAHICCCRMCQKAVGNAFAALIAAPESELKWLNEEPARFASSEVADRGFCRHCGTPLFYQARGSGRVNLTIGSLDSPEDFAPKEQIGTEGKVSWCDLLPTLPDGGTTESTISAELAERIRATNTQVGCG